MKKKVIIAMGLAVLSTSALASKARLEALGQNADGSMWIDDARNVLLNPARLNYHKDFVTLEFGDTSNEVDSADTPRAEGGVFKASGNMVYGLYFGNQSDLSNALRRKAVGDIDPTGDTQYITETNTTDLFVAGDAGVQWGARLSYETYENEAFDAEASALRLKVGVISGDTDVFLGYGLQNKAEADDAEFKGNGSIDLGVTHSVNDVSYMVRYASINAENGDDDEYKAQTTMIGAGKMYKLNDKASAWAEAWYVMNNTECDAAFGGNADTDPCFEGDTKTNFLPIVMGVEVQAKEWLALRASLSHNITGDVEVDSGDKITIPDSTAVAAGASLTWGDLSVDGMIGNTDGSGTAGDDTAGGDGTLRTDELLTRVSMTYKF